MEKYIIWSSTRNSPGDCKKTLETEKSNLNVALNNDMVVITESSVDANVVILKGNLSNIFINSSNAIYYVDSRRNARCIYKHGDKTERYLFRVWKDNLSELQKQHFINAAQHHTLTSSKLSYYTKRIGDLVEKCYGLGNSDITDCVIA